MNAAKILAKDYVFMLKYQDYSRLSPCSPPGQIRILTSNVQRVVAMLQVMQTSTQDSGRFEINYPRTNVVDVVLKPKADPDYIYDMIACRIAALRDEFYAKAVAEIEASKPTEWKAQDEIGLTAELVETSRGEVVVRPVLNSLKASSSTRTKRLPDKARLLEMGLILSVD